MAALCFPPVASAGDSAGDLLRVSPSFVYLSFWIFIYLLYLALLFYFFICFILLYILHILLILTYSGYIVMLGLVITFDKSYTRTWVMHSVIGGNRTDCFGMLVRVCVCFRKMLR